LMQLEVALVFLGLLDEELTHFVEFLSNQNANKGGIMKKFFISYLAFLCSTSIYSGPEKEFHYETKLSSHWWHHQPNLIYTINGCNK